MSETERQTDKHSVNNAVYTLCPIWGLPIEMQSQARCLSPKLSLMGLFVVIIRIIVIFLRNLGFDY